MNDPNIQITEAAKPRITVKVEVNGQLATQLEMDEASFQTTPNGVVMVGSANAPGKKLGPADFLQALVYAKAIKPMGPEFAHLPAGVYTTLVQNACIPLEKGQQGGQGIEGYFVRRDPEDAVQGILEAIRGDAWDSDKTDVAGDEGSDDSVKVLWKRVH